MVLCESMNVSSVKEQGLTIPFLKVGFHGDMTAPHPENRASHLKLSLLQTNHDFSRLTMRTLYLPTSLTLYETIHRVSSIHQSPLFSHVVPPSVDQYFH